MRASPARLAGVGAFVLGGLLVFAVGLFMIGDRQMAFARKRTVYTEFTRITGLQPGALVRVSGARAGSVRQILPPSTPAGKFRIELDIVEELEQLVRTDSVASIEAEGLVGGSFLGVSTGSPNMPIAPVGATLPSREPFEIADLLQQMSGTIVRVNAAVDSLTGQVQQALDGVVVTVGTANTLITSVADDVTVIANSGARISRDMAEITDQVQNGNGTVARLLHDDALYRRLAAVAEHGEVIAGDARRTMASVRETVERFKGADSDVTGLTDDLRQTLVEARGAMSGFAENMDALKRNFLFRGFFNRRGYFDLEELSPDAYRRGALTADGKRQAQRTWVRDDQVFDPAATPGPALTADGKARLDAAIALFLDRLPAGVLVVEGYSRRGNREQQFLTSRARASVARDYLLTRFSLDPGRVAAMPLADAVTETPRLDAWDGEGIALAYFAEPTRR